MASREQVEGLAVIVLAHRAPGQVRRLIRALPGADVFLHCDKKAPPSVAAAMVEPVRSARVTPLPRRSVRVSGWSLVRVELDALRIALDRCTAPHIAVMSSSDYPMVRPAVLSEALASWSGRTWMRSVALPYEPWNARFAKDGGLWRWQWYFPTFRDNVIGRNSLVATIPVRRKVPSGLMLRSSPHWKVYSRADARRLLDVLDRNPDLVRFGRHTFIPEESFIASVLASPRYMGDHALPERGEGAFYVNWPSTDKAQQHPDTIGTSDLDRIAVRLSGGRNGGGSWAKPVFARKFPDQPGVYDLVEKIVWPATAR